MKMKILITGSSGMLGKALWQELHRDCKLFGIDQAKSSNFRSPSFECDISNEKSTADIIGKIDPEVVIHAAAWTDVDGCERDKDKAYKINSEGTRNVALAAEKTGATLIYISTDFVFDGKKKTPYKETDTPKAISVYGDSKLEGEKVIRKISKKYLILRTSWLYGENGNNFVDTIIGLAKKRDHLKIVCDQRGSPTYTKDLAKAVHLLLDRVKGNGLRVKGIYHISNAGSVSWCDYTMEILKITGLKTKVIPITSEELARPAKRPAMSILDNSKFIKFTGYKMRHWKDALKEYLS